MQKKLLVKSGCSLQPSFLTLQSLIIMQRNLLVVAELVVRGTQCIVIILKTSLFQVQDSHFGILIILNVSSPEPYPYLSFTDHREKTKEA